MDMGDKKTFQKLKSRLVQELLKRRIEPSTHIICLSDKDSHIAAVEFYRIAENNLFWGGEYDTPRKDIAEMGLEEFEKELKAGSDFGLLFRRCSLSWFRGKNTEITQNENRKRGKLMGTKNESFGEILEDAGVYSVSLELRILAVAKAKNKQLRAACERYLRQVEELGVPDVVKHIKNSVTYTMMKAAVTK